MITILNTEIHNFVSVAAHYEIHDIAVGTGLRSLEQNQKETHVFNDVFWFSIIDKRYV